MKQIPQSNIPTKPSLTKSEKDDETALKDCRFLVTLTHIYTHRTQKHEQEQKHHIFILLYPPYNKNVKINVRKNIHYTHMQTHHIHHLALFTIYSMKTIKEQLQLHREHERNNKTSTTEK